ncbi:hypothetical protein Enr17x_59360 [Gimesia fumaroli]|uniref:Uncharacterized protein n=1 Tax=Gimesia fumaroli TaxID=2527976 RepID=A0A518IL81_9PLAN|nr:hypothetical protein Enr17x_59360 [Gimesia fumaroli]
MWRVRVTAKLTDEWILFESGNVLVEETSDRNVALKVLHTQEFSRSTKNASTVQRGVNDTGDQQNLVF